jgi:hypothetical protein
MRAFLRSRPVQLTAAVFLIILSPIVGAIPGPGGIFVFGAGMVLLMRNSRWARKHVARAGKRWPRLGAFVDKGLRRASAKRRQAARGRLEEEGSR